MPSTTEAKASLTSNRSMLFSSSQRASGRPPSRDRPFKHEHGVGADHGLGADARPRLDAQRFRLSRDIRSTAAAPSEIWLELPAVIECPGLNAGAAAEVAS